MRGIFWSLISAALFVVGLVPALAAPIDSLADPFVDTKSRFAAANSVLRSAPDAQARAEAAAELALLAYFGEQPQLLGGALEAAVPETAQTARIAQLSNRLIVAETASAAAPLRAKLSGVMKDDKVYGPVGRAIAAGGLGRRAFLDDDIKAAIAHFDDAAQLAKAALPPNDPIALSFQLTWAIHLRYLETARGQEEVAAVERLAAAHLPKDHPLWVPILSATAEALLGRGRHAASAELYARISDIARQHWRSDDPRLFGILQMRAVALSGATRYDDAVGAAQAALAVEGKQPLGDKVMHRELIGSVLLGAGRTEEALAITQESLDLANGLDPDDLRWGHVRARLGRLYGLAGRHEEAKAMFDAALPQLRAKLPANHPNLIVVEQMRANALAEAGEAPAAFRDLAPVIKASESRFLDIATSELEMRSVANFNHNLFRDFAWIALRAGALEDAWRSAQLATLGELAVSTARIRYPGDSEGFRDALEKLRQAQRAQDKARQDLASAKVEPAALETAIAAREQALAQLSRRYPDYQAKLRPSPVSIAQTQAGLGPGDAIIVPMALGGRAVTVVVTRDRLAWDETPVAWNEVSRLARRLRASLDSTGAAGAGHGTFDAETAYRLYQLFFTPAIRDKLKFKSRLIFPAGGALAQIPPGVLLEAPLRQGRPPAYLVRSFATTIWPDLQAGLAAASADGGSFAGIGDPALGPVGTVRALRSAAIDVGDVRSLPSLPGAGDELRQMKAALGSGQSLLLTGANATEAAVRSADLAHYRVVAFATHGLVSGQIEGLEEPALVLTPGGTGTSTNDGLLLASDIASLKLDADWVILSACSTAAGDGRTSAAYGGLARAFRVAGARSLLLSHWPLRDDVAAYLSVRTIAGVRSGLSRAEALRRAQLALLADPKVSGAAAPALWAPLVLIEN